jgi:hypothetical protein
MLIFDHDLCQRVWQAFLIIRLVAAFSLSSHVKECPLGVL